MWSLENTGKETGECRGEQAGSECEAKVSRDVLGLEHTGARGGLQATEHTRYSPQSTLYNCKGQAWRCILLIAFYNLLCFSAEK